jgi:AmmeMemoRadiSam system protein B
MYFILLTRDTIFILGPSHHVRLSGCALTQTNEYETPLYNLIIDEESMIIFF